MITFSINLPILIILWWIGAVIAGISLLIPQYNYYLIVSCLGWITMAITSGLIKYPIKRKNKESQKNMPSKIS